MTVRDGLKRGRGAVSNPKGRFEKLEVVVEGQDWGPTQEESTQEEKRLEPESLPTLYLRDTSKSVISRNQSPDVPFDVSLNPYRGCEHGCIYCYARPTHEFLGFSAGLDFETRVLVKEDAPQLLQKELESPGWEPTLLGLSGVTDPYQPVERQLEITRRCLEVLARMRHPVGVVTKNPMVTRDIDLLAELAEHGAVSVTLSITTLDADLARKMEPRAGHPRRRLEAVAQLARAGIPVGVLVAPVLPALTDHEMPKILEAAAEAGASSAGYVVLRLPGAVEELFVEWLRTHFPDREKKVLSRTRSLRDGKLHDGRFGHRMRGQGAFADQVRAMFEVARRRNGLDQRGWRPSAAAFRRPNQQLDLFG